MNRPAAQDVTTASGSVGHRGADGIRERLTEYYARYYRDTLGLPDWQTLVSVRLDDQRYEGERLARLEGLVGAALSGCRMLNVGCGPGGFNVAATGAGARAWGVDSSWDAVAIARDRVPAGRVVCATAEALPFIDGWFDVIYCYSTLEHVEEVSSALREMARVLQPGGALYLHTPNRLSCFESHYKLFWPPGLPGWVARLYLSVRRRPVAFAETLRLLTLGECRRLVEQAGFRVSRVMNLDRARPVGGPLWPLVRLYYRLFGIHPYVELLAVREAEP